MTLFGIPLTALFLAIAQVESRNGQDPAAHGNVYQIDSHGGHAYVDDVNRIIHVTADGLPDFQYADIYDRAKSEQMMFHYWKWYGQRLQARGIQPTAELLAKMHNVGYRGLTTKPTAAQAYWVKVKRELEK